MIIQNLYKSYQQNIDKMQKIDSKIIKFDNIDITSRYHNDFEELASIGRGGYGNVVQVKNRLDGLQYAIKKIRVYKSYGLEKILREVKTLSRIHHKNVVRYFQAWIEQDSDSSKIDRDDVYDFSVSLDDDTD